MSAGEVDLGANRKKARAQVLLKQSDYHGMRNESPDCLSGSDAEVTPTNYGRS